MTAQALRQDGAALITALILLLVITLLALAATRTSTLEMRMASNSGARVTAAQVAIGMAESVTANPSSTPVIGNVGIRMCLGGVPEDVPDCDVMDSLSIPEEAEPTGTRFVSVERLGSETRPPPRGVGSSLTQFGAAGFRIHARYVDDLGNRADAYEGVLVLVPKTGSN